MCLKKAIVVIFQIGQTWIEQIIEMNKPGGRAATEVVVFTRGHAVN